MTPKFIEEYHKYEKEVNTQKDRKHVHLWGTDGFSPERWVEN